MKTYRVLTRDKTGTDEHIVNAENEQEALNKFENSYHALELVEEEGEENDTE